MKATDLARELASRHRLSYPELCTETKSAMLRELRRKQLKELEELLA